MTTVNNAKATSGDAPLCPDCEGRGGTFIEDEAGGHCEDCSLCRGHGTLTCEALPRYLSHRDRRECGAPVEVLLYDCGPNTSVPLVLCRECTGELGPEYTTVRREGLLVVTFRPAVAPACSEAA